VKAPKVSVLCLAFNQIKFIRQALDGFVSQKTNFDFEVIINDDASTDGTADVIRAYRDRYPEIIKPIFQPENQYSKGVRGLTVRFLLPAAAGDYISLCEGDDYFTDQNKLQAQADFLDQNPGHALCFHPVRVVYENNESPGFVFPPACDPKDFTLRRLMQANFIQTNSVMYRRREYKNLPVDILPSDWYLHLYHARYGKIGFLDRVMSVYRRHPGGIWWSAGNDRNAFFRKHGPMHLSMYLELLKLFGHDDIYRKTILNNIAEMAGCVLNVAQKDKWQDGNETARLVKKILGGTGGLDKVKIFVDRRCSAGGMEEHTLAIAGSNPGAIAQAVKSAKFLIGSAWKSRFHTANAGIKKIKNVSAIRLEFDTGLIAKNGLKPDDVCRAAALSAGGMAAGRKNISNSSEVLTIVLDDKAACVPAAGKILSAECANASGEAVKVADCLKTRNCVADIVVESKIDLELPVEEERNGPGTRDVFVAIDMHCPQPVWPAIKEKLGSLTLITCANNTPETLASMLKSFTAFHGDGPHRLILFENSTGEHAANMLDESRIPYIRNAGGAYAGSIDEAIKICTTKHALIVSPDIVFNQSVISLYEAFIKNDGIIMGEVCGAPAEVRPGFIFIDAEKINRAGISFLGSRTSFYGEIRNAGLNIIQCKADPDFFTRCTDAGRGSEAADSYCHETAKYGSVEIKGRFIPGFSGRPGAIKSTVDLAGIDHAISAVVPVLCWTPAAARAIASLAGQMGKKDEVIVVSADDPGAGGISASIPANTGIKILTAVKGANLSSLYNAGIRASSGGVIILLREDIICGEGFFEAQRRGHKEHPGEKAAIIGNIYAIKQSRGETINQYLNGGGIEQVDFEALGGNACKAGPGFFNTSCVSVKKEFLSGNGAFDEVFGDIITPARELGRRLFENGMELIYLPDIRVEWEHPLKFMEYARTGYLEGRFYPYFLDKFRISGKKDFTGPLSGGGLTWDELMEAEKLKWEEAEKSGDNAGIGKYVSEIFRASFFRGARDAAAENSMGEMLHFEKGKWGAYKTGKNGACVSLVSEYDPEREARLIASRIPADKNIVFIGAGMGRHINEYLSAGLSRRAALYEPHDALFDYLRTKMDMERVTRIKERGGLSALRDKGYEAVILPSLKNTECEYSEAYKSFPPDGTAISG